MVHAVVLQKILVVLAVVAVGFASRRAGVLDDRGTAGASRVVVDVAFPALVLVQLPRTVDATILAASWPVPLAGLLLVGGGTLLGRVLGRSPTEAFLIGLPNWVFLPLLIAEALYGEAGVRTVLLVNAGAQVALWTVAVGTLSGRASLRGLLNPGLIATAVGLAVAVGLPEVAAVVRDGGQGWWAPAAAGVVEALSLVGQLAVPLSLLTTGAQLAQAGGGPIPWGGLARVMVGRMALVPAIATAALLAAGAGLADDVRTVLLITAAMPVAISGSLFAERFCGDTGLAARAVLASTVLSLATVPGLLWLVAWWRGG